MFLMTGGNCDKEKLVKRDLAYTLQESTSLAIFPILAKYIGGNCFFFLVLVK